MPLRTVRVPSDLSPVFEKAEELVAAYFADRHESPEQGTIEIAGERYLLVRAGSLSVEFFALVRDLFGEARAGDADEFARNILFDLAHSLGRSDAQRFHQRMNLTDPLEKLTAGPIHFAHAGWAFVDIHADSKPSPDEAFYMHYDHPYSFEAEAWISAKRTADFPVCIMNSGYSSGWCEESFGVPLVATELYCRARGDEHCRFVMAHPDHLEALVGAYLDREEAPAARRQYQIPDFFARKRVEEELRQARDELEARVEERTRELRRANERLQSEIDARRRVEAQLVQTQKLEALGRLATGIAHDFNNLMTVVIGHSGLLAEEPGTTSDARSQLVEIREAGERAAEICQQLLAFGSSHHQEPQLFDVRGLVERSGKLLRVVLGDGFVFSIDVGRESAGVRADRASLTQVLLNLCVNARDAMPSGGSVSVDVARVDTPDAAVDSRVPDGSWVRVSVSDTGPGMDDETLAKVFEPFFSTKRAAGGTGLGLSTVYGITQRFGGHVLASSPEGGGARFDVFLPRVDLGSTHDAAGAEQRERERGTEVVLVVEDRDAPRGFIVRALARAGYEVLEAGAPSAALERVIDAPRVDLVVTDVIMPEMSGPDLVREMREAHGAASRVLFVTGFADDDARAQIDELGAELLPKPFSSGSLLRAVRRALDAPAGSPVDSQGD